jgi:hypothetical protein
VIDHLTQALDEYDPFERRLEASPTTREPARRLAYLRLREACRSTIAELHRLRAIVLDGRVVKVVES